MKKVLASLLVLAMCAPAMALTLSTSATDNVLTISYDLAEGEVLRGLALTVTRQSGDAAVISDADYTAPAFNTFMDYAYEAPTTYQIDTGHPFALTSGPGVAGFPTSEFSLSLGYLDEDGDEVKGEGITEDGAITVTFDGTPGTTSTFDIDVDTLRGGAVGDDLVVSGLPATGVAITIPGDDICLGDGTGDGAINGADVAGLLATFNLVEGNEGYNPVYDFTGDKAVNGADIGGFLAVFNTLCP